MSANSSSVTTAFGMATTNTIPLPGATSCESQGDPNNNAALNAAILHGLLQLSEKGLHFTTSNPLENIGPDVIQLSAPIAETLDDSQFFMFRKNGGHSCKVRGMAGIALLLEVSYCGARDPSFTPCQNCPTFEDYFASKPRIIEENKNMSKVYPHVGFCSQCNEGVIKNPEQWRHSVVCDSEGKPMTVGSSDSPLHCARLLGPLFDTGNAITGLHLNAEFWQGLQQALAIPQRIGHFNFLTLVQICFSEHRLWTGKELGDAVLNEDPVGYMPPSMRQPGFKRTPSEAQKKAAEKRKRLNLAPLKTDRNLNTLATAAQLAARPDMNMSGGEPPRLTQQQISQQQQQYVQQLSHMPRLSAPLSAISLLGADPFAFPIMTQSGMMGAQFKRSSKPQTFHIRAAMTCLRGQNSPNVNALALDRALTDLHAYVRRPESRALKPITKRGNAETYTELTPVFTHSTVSAFRLFQRSEPLVNRQISASAQIADLDNLPQIPLSFMRSFSMNFNDLNTIPITNAVGTPIAVPLDPGLVQMMPPISTPHQTMTDPHQFIPSANSNPPRATPLVSREWPEEWLSMSCVPFNKFLKTSGLNQQEIAELKRARRRRKNRIYAKKSRERRNQKIEQATQKLHEMGHINTKPPKDSATL